MKRIQLLPIGRIHIDMLESLRLPLAREFEARVDILPVSLDPSFAYDPQRQQYHSTRLLTGMSGLAESGSWRLLGVTSLDLFIPILTYVFGEAQVGDRCALVSWHRLRQEFYGLPPDESLLFERLQKEAVHELGHTLGLRHCEDYSCAMASSPSVEWIDVKGVALCRGCRSRSRH